MLFSCLVVTCPNGYGCVLPKACLLLSISMKPNQIKPMARTDSVASRQAWRQSHHTGYTAVMISVVAKPTCREPWYNVTCSSPTFIHCAEQSWHVQDVYGQGTKWGGIM